MRPILRKGRFHVAFVSASGDDDRWYQDTRTFTGVGRGPASYQDRIRMVLVAEVDPAGRIKLPKQKRGAGW